MSQTQRKTGRKEKRQEIEDSPEKQRQSKKMNLNQAQSQEYFSYEDPVNTSGTDTDSSSEIEEPIVGKSRQLPKDLARGQHTSSPKVRTTSPPQNTYVSFSDIFDNFGDMFHAALAEPRTTKMMQDMLKPIMKKQTAEIKKEVKSLKEELGVQKREIQELTGEFKKLKRGSEKYESQNVLLQNTVQQQQRYLESIDFDRRKNNMIITGVAEDAPLMKKSTSEPATTDIEKIEEILEVINHNDVTIEDIHRLGEKQTGPRARPRPIKVILNDAKNRGNILRDSKKLKTAGETLSKVYINKDTHPGILREQKRIRAVEKREKEKPENAGRSVRYDWKQRCVMIDDHIIDTFKPSFF